VGIGRNRFMAFTMNAPTPDRLLSSGPARTAWHHHYMRDGTLARWSQLESFLRSVDGLMGCN
jgi:hypothetical protein